MTQSEFWDRYVRLEFKVKNLEEQIQRLMGFIETERKLTIEKLAASDDVLERERTLQKHKSRRPIAEA